MLGLTADGLGLRCALIFFFLARGELYRYLKWLDKYLPNTLNNYFEVVPIVIFVCA